MFFARKLPGAQPAGGARHMAYRIVSRDGMVLLPNLTISRGSGGEDLDFRNIKGLADDMGLSLEGFVQACKCRVGYRIVAFCVACRVVGHAATMHFLDKISYDESMIALITEALTKWLDGLRAGKAVKLSKRESKEIARSMQRMRENEGIAAFPVITDFLTSYADTEFGFSG